MNPGMDEPPLAPNKHQWHNFGGCDHLVGKNGVTFRVGIPDTASNQYPNWTLSLQILTSRGWHALETRTPVANSRAMEVVKALKEYAEKLVEIGATCVP